MTEKTMAFVWDKLTLEDKTILMECLDNQAPASLAVLALMPIQKIARFMISGSPDNGKTEFPRNCPCGMCKKYGGKLEQIYNVLQAAADEG